jgi:hypothetical protein
MSASCGIGDSEKKKSAATGSDEEGADPAK